MITKGNGQNEDFDNSHGCENEAGLYIKLFLTFLKLGLFTIGGGMAMIPLLKDEMVNKKGWLSEDEMLDCLSVSQGLPGVIAVNMATYIGYRKKGPLGSLLSTIGVILPSFIAIILVIEILEQVSASPYVSGAIAGIKAVATALILVATYQVGRQALRTPLHFIMAAATLIAVGILSMNAVYAILAGCGIGIVSTFLKPTETKNTTSGEKANMNSGGKKVTDIKEGLPDQTGDEEEQDGNNMG